MAVACGNKVHDRGVSKVHHHLSVAQVRLCFSRPTGLPSLEDGDWEVYESQQMEAELAAERANERYFEERGGGTYAGSQEEARDRYLDGLNWEQSYSQPQDPAQPAVSTPDRQGGTTTAKARVDLPADWRDGVYTIETPTGHRTLRFRTQDSDSAFKPGLQLVSYLSGPSNDFAYGDWTQFGHVERTAHGGVLRVWVKHRDNKDLDADWLTFTSLLVTDPEAILKAVHCYRCHALLTVPESIERGWGPECRRRGLR